MSMKNPLTPAGIEPATFRFVAQHLNHCATAVPPCRTQYTMAWKTNRALVHRGIIALFCAYRAELQIICMNKMQSFAVCAYSSNLAWTVLITRLTGNGFQIQLRTNEGGLHIMGSGGPEGGPGLNSVVCFCVSSQYHYLSTVQINPSRPSQSYSATESQGRAYLFCFGFCTSIQISC